MKYKTFISVILILQLLSLVLIAQDKVKKTYQRDKNINYIKEYPDIDYYKATFQGGIDDFLKYFEDNYEFPESHKKNKLEGKVFVRFLIDTDGTCPYAQIWKGLSDEYDDEVLRVIKNTPRWNPGKKKDSTIAYSWFTMPIKIEK